MFTYLDCHSWYHTRHVCGKCRVGVHCAIATTALAVAVALILAAVSIDAASAVCVSAATTVVGFGGAATARPAAGVTWLSCPCLSAVSVVCRIRSPFQRAPAGGAYRNIKIQVQDALEVLYFGPGAWV